MIRPSLSEYVHFVQGLDLILSGLTVFAVAVGIVGAPAVKLRSQPIPAISDGVFKALLFPLALALRVPLLFDTLWYDEAFTRQLVVIPLKNFLPALLGDVHPPGFYLLARFLVSIFGLSNLALRLPSLIAGLILIVLVYRVALRLHGDRRAAQIAALIVAVLPSAIYYSTEARYPAILACLVLASVIALLDDKPLRFALFTGLIVWFHSLGVFYVALLCLMALVKWRRSQRHLWFGAVLIAGCIAGLWLPGLLYQSENVAAGFWLPNMFPFWHLVTMTMRKEIPAAPVLFLTWFTPLLLSVFGAWASRRWIKASPLWLLLVVVLPLLLWLIGVIWHPVYLDRALIAPALLVVVTWAWLLVQARSWWRFLFSVMLVAGVVAGNAQQYSQDRTQIPDYFRECVGVDYVYTTSLNMQIMAIDYADKPVLGFAEGNNLHQSLNEVARQAMGLTTRPLDEVHGDVCVISQISYYTTDAEMREIERIKRAYRPEWVLQFAQKNQLFSYVVMRFEK